MAVTEVAVTAGADSKGSFCEMTFWAYSPDRKCKCVSTWSLPPWLRVALGQSPHFLICRAWRRHLLWGCQVEVLKEWGSFLWPLFSSHRWPPKDGVPAFLCVTRAQLVQQLRKHV